MGMQYFIQCSQLGGQRSIGVQVNLCCQPQVSTSNTDTQPVIEQTRTNSLRFINMSTEKPESTTGTYSNSSNANASCSSSRAESQRLSEGEPNVFEDEVDSRLLAQQHPDSDPSHKSPSGSRHGSSSSNAPGGLTKSSSTSDPAADPLLPVKRDSSSHSYHFKRKFANFRSDSVFSDVMPMASTSSGSIQDPRKGSADPIEKKSGGGSLSSLKPRESKWISLRKKLKINSSGSSSSSSSKKAQKQEEEKKNGGKSIEEKRTLFQRAKTLSIMPVSRVHKERGSRDETRDDPTHRKQHHMVREPPELFNVGGEMNMIPLEFLINIEDLKVSK